MKKKSPRIVFFGNERLSTAFEPKGAPTLTRLVEAGYTIAAVVANFESGTSRKSRELEIEAVARAHNIPVLLPKKLSEIIATLEDLQADCGVLVAYGKIIPQAIIDIFPRGIVNIHPSLLPLYRGSTPIEQAILDGATQTGVSLMQLVKAMDAGPVFAQKVYSLQRDEDKFTLTTALLELGGELLVQNLPSILEGTAQPIPQNESKATYTSLLRKEDGRINLSDSAIKIERQIRAFAGWPKSTMTLFDTYQIVVKKARVANDANDGALTVVCGDSTFLELLELVAPSGRTMSGADFVRGYKR